MRSEVDAEANKVLREYDDEVLRAHYAKEITVTNNPNQLVVFPNGGRIKLSVLSARLRRNTRLRFVTTVALSIIGILIGSAGLIIAIVK
jgi:hypothetical protein